MIKVGLRGKLVIFTASLLVLVFGASTYYLARNSAADLRSGLLNQARAFSSLATDPIGSTFVLYGESGTIRVQGKMDEFAALDPVVSNISVVNLEGKVLFSRDAKNIPKIDATTASSFVPVYEYDNGNNVTRVVYPYIENFGVHRYAIVYDFSTAGIHAATRQTVLSLLFFNLFALISANILLYSFLNYFMIRPIRVVSQQAGLISAGKLDQKVEVSGDDEVTKLSQSVNKMAESLKADIYKLKESDRLKSEFLMIASHNIRTPLTIIDGYLSDIDSYETVEEARQAMEKIASGAKRLDVFAEDMLTISLLEAGDKLITRDSLSLSEFVESIGNDFETLAKAKNLKFKAHICHEKLETKASKPHLRAAIWNLLDNALKFTHEGGEVTLSIEPQGQAARIRVSDTGTGIAPEEMPKLFTKFHRGTSTLTYDYEGSGIGLYASKLIVDQHGGDISAESTLGHGSVFTIHLPLNKVDLES